MLVWGINQCQSGPTRFAAYRRSSVFQVFDQLRRTSPYTHPVRRSDSRYGRYGGV